MALQAVIFVPDVHATAATDRCLDHCHASGYTVFGVVAGDWDAVAQILYDGTAQVLVLDSHHDMPVDALPRFEIVADAILESPTQRRTMLLRRRPRLVTRRGVAT